MWDCGDFRGETEAEGDVGRPLCNSVLITGPPGVGKTASVYACAQELGFKVVIPCANFVKFSVLFGEDFNAFNPENK